MVNSKTLLITEDIWIRHLHVTCDHRVWTSMHVCIIVIYIIGIQCFMLKDVSPIICISFSSLIQYNGIICTPLNKKLYLITQMYIRNAKWKQVSNIISYSLCVYFYMMVVSFVRFIFKLNILTIRRMQFKSLCKLSDVRNWKYIWIIRS